MSTKRIVLLHGWSASVDRLRPLSKELRKMGWDVFLPKLPGFDLPVPNEIWGVGEYGRYVLQKANKRFKSEKYYLFGHSFGGRISIKLAAAYAPPLLGVILCSVAGIPKVNVIRNSVFWVFAKAGKVLLVIPPAAKLFRKALYYVAGIHDYNKARGKMKDILKKVVTENLRVMVSKITLPTLILWGRLDTLTPVEDAQYIKSVLPKAKLRIFESEGHKLPYNKPKELASEINKWVKSLN